MDTPYNPDQDQSQGQGDPYVDSLANADGDSVKAMTASLYGEAPSASLMTRTPPQRKSQSAVRSLYDMANNSVAGYLDPVLRGAAKGYDQLGRSVASGMAFASSKLGADETGEWMQGLRKIQRDGMVTAKIAQAALGPDQNSGLHAFVRDASQFAAVAEVLGGKAIAGEAVGAAKWGIRAVQGATADALGFDPRQERLSNLIENAPGGIGTIASAIAANPNDSEAKARFKAALEGVAMNSTIDLALHGISRLGGRVKEAIKTYAEPAAPTEGQVRAPRLSDFTPATAASTEKPAVNEPFTVEQTPLGQHRVVPKDAEYADAMREHLGSGATFDQPEQAESVAASLNYASKNAQRPKLDVTPEQAGYLKTLAQWIHSTGKYEDFQNGSLDVDTGARVDGVHDNNFAYDLEPEQVGHLISSMSAVFRNEINAARVPQSLMRDASEGGSITHAETVAKAAQDYSGVSGADARSRFNDIADAVDEAPSAVVAAKVLRQNIAQSAEQLTRAMDANPDNTVAHAEFLKAANSLMQTFVAEKRLTSGLGRGLNAAQIKVGANGAAVDAEALGRAMRNRSIDPLDVLHFELIDEPTGDAAVSELDNVREPVSPDAAPDSPAPANTEAAASGTPAAPKEPRAKKAPNDKANVGPNTYTVADEALTKIDKALKSIDEAELARKSQDVPTAAEAEAKQTAGDRGTLKAVRKDKALMKSTADGLGITEEDAALAKARMRAANNIIAEKRAAGAKDALEGLSPDELTDVASIDAERVKRLADAQRKNPLADPRPEKPKPEGADAEAKAKKAPKDKANVGTNTFTLTDEADHRIAEAQKKIDETLKAQAKETPEESATRQDKMAARQLPKNDPERVTAAVDWMGGTDEDVKLAKDRLKAIRQTIQEKRESAGMNTVDWSRYSDVELDDLAMMHGERIMQLAQEQRANPMVPRNERTVYLTARQARALARQMTYVPRDSKEQEQVLTAILGAGRKATENTADAAPSVWDKVVNYRRWSMLSAPTTPEVNFFSAVSTALYRPIEGMLGGATQLDGEAVRRYGDLMNGTLKSFKDAMGMAKVSWETGGSVLTARDPSVPQVGPAGGSGMISKVLGFLGVNERLMTAGDEFAQQIAYRGHVYAQSMSNSRRAGVTDAAEMASRAQDDIGKAFDAAGQGQNPAAVSYAQDVTLRRELEYGVGKWIEDGAKSVPAIRVIFPFTRIPANLARFAMDRAPGVGALTRRNIGDFAAGGSQRDEMIGRQVAGTMIWSSAALMSHAGILTGGGPKDPELRRQWLNVYQPYSIKLPGTDQWVSYRRFEPLSTPLGIVSDFMDMMGELENEGDAAKAIDGFVAGVGSNLMSKAYLKSMSDFFYAMGSGKATATDSFIDGIAGSFVPNIVQKLNPDDALRSTRDFVDRMQARIPGMSEELEPRRNIYGEKVMKPGNQFQRMFNPFTVKENKADPVDVELLRLGVGMSMPVPRKYGVDLQDRSIGIDGQSPYDRWMELMSQPISDGQPALRDALRSLVQSDQYKQLTDGSEGFKGSRLLAVERTVRGYRQAAFAKMVQENPKVLDAIRVQAVKKGSALSDDPDVTEALTGHSTDAQLRGHAGEAAALMGGQ